LTICSMHSVACRSFDSLESFLRNLFLFWFVISRMSIYLRFKSSCFTNS
jgi:hypothetical protein